MYIRVIRTRTHPGKVHELTRRWRADFAPVLREVAGFRQAFFAADRGRNAVVVVTLWDDLPQASHYGPILARFQESVADIVPASTVMEEFEVLAEVDALQ